MQELEPPCDDKRSSSSNGSDKHFHGRLGLAVSVASAGILSPLKTSLPRREPQAISDTERSLHEDAGSKQIRCGRVGLVRSSPAPKYSVHSQMDRRIVACRDCG